MASRIQKPLTLLLLLLWKLPALGLLRTEAATLANSRVEFATLEPARTVLGSPDEFTRRMSPFDRSARLKTAAAVSAAEHLAFASSCALAWESDEIERINTSLARLGPKLEGLRHRLPETVVLIKTSGREEGSAAYTRGTAIILPKSKLNIPADALDRLLCHEVFHLFSRANPGLRRELYPIIGFVNGEELSLPSSIADRRLTNPDAPQRDAFIQLRKDGTTLWAAPFLKTTADTYDPTTGREFFAYLQFKLLVVEPVRGKPGGFAVENPEAPRFLDPKDIPDFAEKIGRNTSYIIHPEEILADNFVHTVLRTESLATPRIVEEIRALLFKPDR